MFRYQQMIYIYLLQRYLLLRYRSESQSQIKFEKLMNCLKYSEIVAKIMREGLGNYIDFPGFPPLLQEVFK